jgi:hypothetical protein
MLKVVVPTFTAKVLYTHREKNVFMSICANCGKGSSFMSQLFAYIAGQLKAMQPTLCNSRGSYILSNSDSDHSLR